MPDVLILERGPVRGQGSGVGGQSGRLSNSPPNRGRQPERSARRGRARAEARSPSNAQSGNEASGSAVAATCSAAVGYAFDLGRTDDIIPTANQQPGAGRQTALALATRRARDLPPPTPLLAKPKLGVYTLKFKTLMRKGEGPTRGRQSGTLLRRRPVGGGTNGAPPMLTP